MRDSELQATLERAEAAYEELDRTRASLGTLLAEAIQRKRGLSEFKRRMEDLPLNIRRADIRRTELKVELLRRRVKEANEEHRRTAEKTRRAAAALEEARRAYARAANVEEGSSLEAQRLEELHRKELERLERLRSETAERQEVATS